MNDKAIVEFLTGWGEQTDGVIGVGYWTRADSENLIASLRSEGWEVHRIEDCIEATRTALTGEHDRVEVTGP